MNKKILLVAIMIAIALPFQGCSKTDKQPQVTQQAVQEIKTPSAETMQDGFYTNAYIKGNGVNNVTGTESTKLRQICNKEEQLISEIVKDKDGTLTISEKNQKNLLQLMKTNNKVYPQATAVNYLLDKYGKESEFFFAVHFGNEKTVGYNVVLVENPEVKLFHGIEQKDFSAMVNLLSKEKEQNFIYKSIEVMIGDDGKFIVSKEGPSILSDVITTPISDIRGKNNSMEEKSEIQITEEKALQLAKDYTKNKTSYNINNIQFAISKNKEPNNPKSMSMQPVNNPQDILYYVTLMDTSRNKYAALICVYKDGTCAITR